MGSGIGVVRLSGTDALKIASAIIGAHKDLTPRQAKLVTLVDPHSNDVIDEAVLTFFRSPRSFTGEDVVEFACHGSPVILRQVIDICLRLGARMADRGEFSLRALANGRIDLAEAEAIRDLIDARTAASVRQAMRQMRGEASNQLQPLKDELLNIIVVLESALEFVEDDLPESDLENIVSRLNKVNERILNIAETFKTGRLLREGLKVALVGRPNVGKSSLFNALLGSERAIVTEIAGTTRDELREQLTIDDIPISLIDTAGLRQTDDLVESIGVLRSRQVMADADVVIVLIDASDPQWPEEDLSNLMANVLHVLNKIDLIENGDAERITEEFSSRYDVMPVLISAKTGQGIAELKQAIKDPSLAKISTGGWLVSDARHHDLLLRAGEETSLSVTLLRQKVSEEISLVGLHNALRYLGEITGETTTEDMLTRIFATFCIGK